MKDRLFTNSVRNIKKAFPRFLSLLIMGALGVFAFAGLMAVAPDMINSLDRYLDDKNVYDIKIISDMGLDPDDVSAIELLPAIEKAEGVKYRDAEVKLGEEEALVNISSLPDGLNEIDLTSGRLPEAKNEIAVEEALLEVNDLEPGDSIYIDDEEGFYEKEVFITGVVKSPLFYNSVEVDNDRGITNIGAGTLKFYAYAPESNFKADYLSIIYATVVGAKEQTTGSEKYLELIDDADSQLEEIRTACQDSRYKTIMGTAEDKINEESKDAKAQLEDAARQLADAKSTLEDVLSQIEEKEGLLKDAEALLADGLRTLKEKQAELESGRAKLLSGKKLLDEKQKEADRGRELIAEGEKKLESGAAQLAKAKEEAAAGKKEIDSGQAKIDEGEKQLKEGWDKLEEGKAQLDKGKEALSYVKNEYNRLVNSEHLTEDIINSEMDRLKTDIDALRGIFEKLAAQYRAGTITIESAKAVIIEALENYTREPTVLERIVFYKVAETYLEPVVKEGEDTYNNSLKEYEAAEAQLNDAKKKLEDGKKQYEDGLKKIADGEKQLDAGRKELKAKKKELDAGLAKLRAANAEYETGMKTLKEGEKLLSDGYKEYRDKLSEFEQGKEMLEAGKAQYEEGYAEYSSGLAEYEAGRANFDEEIRKAREGISELGTPTWYIYDRTGYQTYAEFFDDADSMRNLSRVYPIVFFLVAILVSLLSMSRMVEMDRLEIGTLKSVGYSREKVITKYAFFSILATVIGSVIGAVSGLIVLPTLIFNIYGMLFDIPKFYVGPNWGTTLIAVFAVLFFVVGAGMLKAVQVMREKPADLLRTKAPKPGKRIFLERLGGFWHKLRFSDKITVRNLFRYKKRLFVTVFGITGCTALILCGFGLKDAIVDIPTAQFDEVFKFDAMAYLTGLNDDSKDSEKIKSVMDDDEITGYTPSMRIKSECDGLETNIVVVENEDDIENIFDLIDEKTGKPLKPEKGKVIINNKLSKLTGLSTGDEISVTDLNHVEHKYKISGVAKNYFEHYVITDKDTLEQFTDYVPNIIYFNTRELTPEQQKDLASRMLEDPEVLNITYKEKLITNADNMLKSLNKVVVILIVMAAILSFVVLYNLSNININERHREIATLKVLGFYDKEVDAYINRENIIVTIIGIILGLVLGIFLTRIVVGTVEIEKASFMNQIKPLSYVFAAGISFLFTLIVNNLTHINLRKIDMIDSLKSVE